MRIVQESIFMNALRAFFVSLFAVFGVIAGLVAMFFCIYGIYSAAEDESGFSSNVKILPDAKGSRKELSSSTPVILQLTLDGEIGKEDLKGEKIEDILLDSREDDFKDGRVKGILLVINSGGGSVNESDIIYRLLKEYKARYSVPIYVFVNGLCASGGYYIACSGDKIFASDVSLVGSIGVLAWPPFLNVTDTLEKIGVDTMTLSAGKGKDEMNPFRPWKPDEQQRYQELLNFYYSQFVALVSKERHIESEELKDKLGAHVFPAAEAKDYGLVDAPNTTRDDALQALADHLGLESYQVVGIDVKSWWKKLFREDSPLVTGRWSMDFSLPLYGRQFPLNYVYRP